MAERAEANTNSGMDADRAGAPPGALDNASLSERLRDAGLRPTRQRVALARIVFGRGDRHLTAESLHAEAREAGVSMSLATVYNALHQFTGSGLLRAFGIEGQATHFDTNTREHHHFVTENGRVMDIPAGAVRLADLPEPPEGMEIAHVDVVVRLRRATRDNSGS